MTFNVTVQPSGASFSVAAGEPILAAAIRQGIGLPYSCKDGACGSCKCMLLSGKVIHGPHQSKALSTLEEKAGFTLTCCATPQSDVTIEARTVAGASEYPPHKMPCRVIRIHKPSIDVAVLHLQLPANNPLRFRPGQYVEFILHDGSRRSYSMANAPNWPSDKPSIELHIRHMPGGKFTDHVFTALKEKEILRLEGPFGSFFLRENSNKPMVLLAGGTGFAPIKSIIEYVELKGLTREMTLYWGSRSKADLYMHDWVLRTAEYLPNLRYVPVLSEPKASDAWCGRLGLVHHAVMKDFPDLSGHQVYACGAPAMIAAAHQDFLIHCGLADEEFYADAFTTEADKHGAFLDPHIE